ncbi:hypothetical protein, partial [uncultured Rikenella sp.]|uniref:hypothetical protein n=1 Tax=uncultured Rikenella sp. TaxID=368003 RepID=UPI00272C2DAD
KTTLTKRPMGAPAGRSDTTYRLSCSAQFFDARLGKSSQNAQVHFDKISLLRRRRTMGLRGLFFL